MNNKIEIASNTVESPIKKIPVEFVDFIDQNPAAAELIAKIRSHDDKLTHANNSPSDTDVDVIKRSDLSEYLGEGDEKAAYVFDNDFVIKVLHKNPYNGEFQTSVNSQVEALLKGSGVEGLEQIVTADIESGVIITKKAEGRRLADIPRVELYKNLKEDHVRRLDSTLKEMVERQLEVDNVQNVLFDPEEGFTLIDYRTPIHVIAREASGNDHENNPPHPLEVEYQELHKTDNFLKEMLSYKKKELENVFLPNGEKAVELRKSIGRRAAAALRPKL